MQSYGVIGLMSWQRVLGNFRSVAGAVTLTALLNGCSLTERGDGGPAGPAPDPDSIADAVPRVEPRSRSGNPHEYVVFGTRYQTLDSHEGYVERGVASWYGNKFHGRRTSSGERYDMYEMTAAHKSLPLPSYVLVTYLENGRRAVVRVNERGPFHDGRIIVMSYLAAAKLDMLEIGTANVEVRALSPEQPIDTQLRIASVNPVQAQSAQPQDLQQVNKQSSRVTAMVPTLHAASARPGLSLTAELGGIGDRQMPNGPRSGNRHLGSAQRLAPLADGERRLDLVGLSPAGPPAGRAVVKSDLPTHIDEALSSTLGTPNVFVQAGAFQARDNAEMLRSALEADLSHPVAVSALSTQDRVLYRVRLGPLPGLTEAQALSDEIRANGHGNASIVFD